MTSPEVPRSSKKGMVWFDIIRVTNKFPLRYLRGLQDAVGVKVWSRSLFLCSGPCMGPSQQKALRPSRPTSIAPTHRSKFIPLKSPRPGCPDPMRADFISESAGCVETSPFPVNLRMVSIIPQFSSGPVIRRPAPPGSYLLPWSKRRGAGGRRRI